MALPRPTQAAMAAAAMAPMRTTMGTTASSSGHKSTQRLHTSHMASPHPTATTALQASSTLQPLARPRMMGAHTDTSSRPRPLSSMLSRCSRHVRSPARPAGNSCRQTMARPTTTTLPLASPSGRGRQDLCEPCQPTASHIHTRRHSTELAYGLVGHSNLGAWSHSGQYIRIVLEVL